MRGLRTTLLLAACALLLVLAGCGDDKGSSSDADPADTVAAALDKAATITSGNSKLKATISTGGLPGSFDITGGGPFDTKAEGGAAYDLDLTVQVAGTEQNVGFAAAGGKSYVTVGDKAVEQKDGQGSFEPGQIADFIGSLDDYLSDVKPAAGKTVDGESLEVYTATVNLKKLIEDASDDEDGLSKLSIPGLGSAQDLATQLSEADLTIGIAGDGYPHELGLNVPLGQDGADGGVRATITLSEINEPQTIEKPDNIVTDSSALGALGRMLGAQ